ncbi:tRNA (N6-isopentenyl adenosine(37)-C2)-methylthiotransferase MiaB [Halobacteriovorax sp. XZX-3]|uniref:tRNA (N6-isopentenyl adenosine(37)-C2)-methylthiotransferase MiaB n=1 Tax=unclassified Halobacteriovorax TaxID=2639665 RepID=UPI000CD10753|nr:tRNA (N6-isopentenyl adenosine(37)-C2)-methylthiotransferase MiaB [Halobacteriovorax sp. DA5]POB14985.1 tRNA (N6-isopentenyl adenosine(37)-C2)-methylthiotransferase MiaB [Halobacteriovorax sp. DA5]
MKRKAIEGKFMTTDISPTGLGVSKQNHVASSFIDEKSGDRIVQLGDVSFPPRKVWMKTYGCQMNYHDTERILSHLKNLNFSHTEELEEASLVLFNTCAVRELANNKFYSQLGELKHLKQQKGDDLVIGVGGCVAQTEGKDLVKKFKHLNFAFGPDTIDTINDMVYRTYAGDDKFSVNTWDRSSNFSIETKINHGTPQAFVNIIKGCDKYCTYCIVPYTRGRERSRKQAEIVEDVRRLVEYQGVQEVMLLGQNVNSFGKENGERLSDLIMDLDQINGLEILRYTTSHPYDVSDDLIAAHGAAKKLSKHLHLPVQSGSNTVLQRMNREYTKEHYLGLLEKLRAAQPDIVLSTDIICGFVNETDEEHKETLDLLERAQFDFIYSYVYSQRSKTRAAKMEDFLTQEIRKSRLHEVQAFQLAIQEKIRAKMVGNEYRVLVEGSNTMKGETKWKGRTNCNRLIHFKGPKENEELNLKWHWVDVKCTSTTALSCQGELLQDHGRRLSK